VKDAGRPDPKANQLDVGYQHDHCKYWGSWVLTLAENDAGDRCNLHRP